MQHIRTHRPVPIIIVSAKDTDADKTLGLVLEPMIILRNHFSVTEVLARIKANIRRSTQYSKPEARSLDDGRSYYKSDELYSGENGTK